VIDNTVAFCIAGVALIIFAALAIIASTYRQRRKYSIPASPASKRRARIALVTFL
jgi:hypothetical protein